MSLVPAAVAAVLAAAAIIVPSSHRAADAAGCASDTSAAGLTATFADHVEGIAGADYQRALRLPDGRILWAFQDAFLDRPDGDDRFVTTSVWCKKGRASACCAPARPAIPRPASHPS